MRLPRPSPRPAPWSVLVAVQALAVQVLWVGVRVLAALVAVERGADAAVLGALAAVTAAPALLGSLLAGRASDRWGGPAVAAVGSVVLLAGTAVVVAAGSLGVLFAGAATAGAGSLLAMVGQQATVAALASARERTGRFAGMTTAASLGQLVAPLLVTGGALGAAGQAAAGPSPGSAMGPTQVVLLLGSGVVALAAAAAGARSSRDRARQRGPSVSGAALLRAPQVWRSLTTSAAVLVTVDLLYALLPLWAAERGVGAGTVGLLLTARAAVSVASRVALQRLVDRLGARVVLVVATAAGAAGLLLLAFGPDEAAWPAVVALGVALGAPQPLTMAWTVGLVPAHQHGAVLGVRLGANRAAQVGVPLVAGLVVAPLGFAGFALVNAALLLGAAVVVLTAALPGGRLPERPG